MITPGDVKKIAKTKGMSPESFIENYCVIEWCESPRKTLYYPNLKRLGDPRFEVVSFGWAFGAHDIDDPTQRFKELKRRAIRWKKKQKEGKNPDHMDILFGRKDACVFYDFKKGLCKIHNVKPQAGVEAFGCRKKEDNGIEDDTKLKYARSWQKCKWYQKFLKKRVLKKRDIKVEMKRDCVLPILGAIFSKAEEILTKKEKPGFTKILENEKARSETPLQIGVLHENSPRTKPDS